MSTKKIAPLRVHDEKAMSYEMADPTGSLRDYLRAIRQHPILSRDDEVRLDASIRLGLRENRKAQRANFAIVEQGEEAMRTLIESNLRLVVHVARRYIHSGLPLMDLIQEGNIGLMQGAKKFDARKGNKFSTYATWWIRQAITRAITNKARIIRLPSATMDEVRRLAKSTRELTVQLGHEPTAEEAASHAGISAGALERILAVPSDPISIEMAVGDRGENALSDILPATEPEPDEHVELFDLSERINTMLGVLKDRDREILIYRFGLDGSHPRTLDEVGRAFRLTRERVRQIEVRAIKKLRECESDGLHEYWNAA